MPSVTAGVTGLVGGAVLVASHAWWKVRHVGLLSRDAAEVASKDEYRATDLADGGIRRFFWDATMVHSALRSTPPDGDRTS